MKFQKHKIILFLLLAAGLTAILYLFIRDDKTPEISLARIYHYSIQQGQQFNEISLDDLIPEIQAVDFRWSFEGNKIVNITLLPDSKVRVNVPDKNWSGTDTISFIAVNKDNQQFVTLGIFNVFPGKNPPELLTIPGQTITAGGSFKPIELNDFILPMGTVYDTIQWSWRGNENLILRIDSQNRLTVKQINKSYTGKEKITLVATNQHGLSLNQEIVFSILPAKKQPGLALLDEVQLNTDEDDILINLEKTLLKYQMDVENLSWHITELKYLTYQIIDNRYLHLKKTEPNWYGIDTVSIALNDNYGFNGKSRLVLTLFPKNIIVLNPILIFSEEEELSINLNESIKTNIDVPINWSIKSSDRLSVEIENDQLKISNKNLRWEGTDTIYFAAHLTDNFLIEGALPLTIISRFSPPAAVQLSEQSIEQDETFSPINLNDYLLYDGKDTEEIIWNYSSNGNFDVDISPDGFAVVKPANPDWYGRDTIIFTANISDRYAVTTKGIFTVNETFFYDRQPFKPIKNVFLTGVNDAVSLIKSPLNWDTYDLAALQSVIIGTLVLSRYDEPLQKQIIKDRRHFNSFIMQFGEWYGRSSTPQLAALAVTGFGLATSNDKATRIGLEIFEAYFFTNNINSIMKRTFGRARPGEEKGSYYFTPFGERPNPQNALPSGHATLSFALSSVLAAHTDQVWLKALIFTPAVITGISRIYHNSHWLSDVFLGSAVGYFVGNFVVNRHSDKADRNFILSLLPGGIGFYYKL